ncbi:hypothetical protein PV772_20605 [Pseudarthrobacter sp. CC12]|uniref:hypothetical protein n=1 Tax=Pseudarthrobacter sp. CC12 TaxID=3029193 RepID=UPI003262DDE7
MSFQQKTWHEKHKASLSTGQRAADIMRNGMGSWPFVASFIGFMLIWAAMAQHDYDTNIEAKKEIELLISMNRVQLEILQELKKAASP